MIGWLPKVVGLEGLRSAGNGRLVLGLYLFISFFFMRRALGQLLSPFSQVAFLPPARRASLLLDWIVILDEG